METLIKLVGQYAHWIYALCGFTALYNIYKTWQIRGERRQAIFTLERQKAADDLHKILFTALILLGVMGTTYFSSTVLATAMGLPAPTRSILDNLGAPATEDLPVDGLTVGDIGIFSAVDQSAITQDENNSQDSAENQSSGEDNLAESGSGSAGETNSGANNSGSSNANTVGADSDNRAQNADQVSTGRSDSAQNTGGQNAGSNTNQNSNQVATQANNISSSSEAGAGSDSLATQPLPNPTFADIPPTTLPIAPPTAPPIAPPTVPPVQPTIVPATAVPVVSPPTCADARASITRPGNGESIKGSFNVMGTATHEQFQFYKLEYASGANAGSGFTYLAGGNSPINNGVLATINPSGVLTNGVWTIRLVVVDLTGNFPNPCSVTITIN